MKLRNIKSLKRKQITGDVHCYRDSHSRDTLCADVFAEDGTKYWVPIIPKSFWDIIGYGGPSKGSNSFRASFMANVDGKYISNIRGVRFIEPITRNNA